jgi:FkbM family methyltransferase
MAEKMDLAQVLTNSIWGKVIRSPLRVIPRDMVVPILSGALRGKRWIVGSQRHACWMGIYESHLQKLIVQRMRSACVFYDVGANAGFYTLLAATRIARGMVFAFEPLPENLAYLRKHVALNHLQNVRIIEAAVSEADGSATFQRENTRAMGRLSEGGSLRVHTVALDTLVFEKGLMPPNYIKMDIEGEEFRALRGGRECFARFRPELFLATHGKTAHEECCHLLGSWNYELHILNDSEADRCEVHAVARC